MDTATDPEPRRVYIDTEFLTSDPSTRGLVAVGLTDDAGRDYYAINAEMDAYHVYTQVSADGTFWMRDNVWPHLPTIDGRPDRLDYSHPDVKPLDQIRDEIAAYLALGPRPHAFAYYGANDMTRLWSLWGNDWATMPDHVPTWHWDIKAEHVRAGSPQMPAHPGRLHHALDDARYDRLMHEHLLALAIPAQARR